MATLTQDDEGDYLMRLRRFCQRKVFSVPVLDFASIGQEDGGNASASINK